MCMYAGVEVYMPRDHFGLCLMCTLCVCVCVCVWVHAHLHGVGEHACQSEGDLLRELFPRHGNLKTVSKVNVQDSASQTVQHEVGGVPESDQSEYINHHR